MRDLSVAPMHSDSLPIYSSLYVHVPQSVPSGQYYRPPVPNGLSPCMVLTGAGRPTDFPFRRILEPMSLRHRNIYRFVIPTCATLWPNCRNQIGTKPHFAVSHGRNLRYISHFAGVTVSMAQTPMKSEEYPQSWVGARLCGHRLQYPHLFGVAVLRGRKGRLLIAQH